MAGPASATRFTLRLHQPLPLAQGLLLTGEAHMMHHGESSLDKPAARTYGMCLHKSESSTPLRDLLGAYYVHWEHSQLVLLRKCSSFQQHQAPWTARPLADQTFGGGSSEHAPGLSGRHATRFFFSPMPLLLASGTMGIEMAIAPLWVKGKRE